MYARFPVVLVTLSLLSMAGRLPVQAQDVDPELIGIAFSASSSSSPPPAIHSIHSPTGTTQPLGFVELPVNVKLEDQRFDWSSAVKQSSMLLMIQHSFR